jgi:hypothetical protein
MAHRVEISPRFFTKGTNRSCVLRDLDSMGHGLSHAIKSYPGGGTRAQNGKGKDADLAAFLH